MKKINYINYFIKISCILGGIIFSIPKIVDKDLYGTFIRLSIILLVLLPNMIRKFTKIKITERMELIYLLFLFVAHFLGSIVDLYHKISWYDTFAHYISGFMTCFLGYLIYVKCKGIKNPFLEVLFLLSFSALVAVSWETFEFVSDQIFGKDAQNVVTTGVSDTMMDMIVALLGCMTTLFAYFIEKYFHKNLFISKFINEIRQNYGDK